MKASLFLKDKGATVLKVVFCILLITLTGCGGGDSSGNQQTIDENAVNAYLPTDDSILLYYNNNTIATYFDANKVVRSESFDVLVYPTDGREYYNNDENTIALRGFFSPSIYVSGAGYYTADVVLDKDLILWSQYMTPGDQVVLSGGGTVNITPTYGKKQASFSFTRTFHGIENVTVPFGSFDAVHVSFEMSISTVVQGVTFTVPFNGEYWFSHGIGIVKRIENGGTLSLTSFEGVDTDGDGLIDVLDKFPNDPTETIDTDNDGIGDNADPDDDGDGVPDESDLFPKNVSEATDFDGDGIGDNADPNDDNDAVVDILDPFPLDPTEWEDTDGDGIGNNADTDDDGDGWSDSDEAACLSDSLDSSSLPVDTDLDGTCNNLDNDDDDDGFPDAEDAFPLDETEWIDTDGDGIGNNADANDDNDRLNDIDDPRPLDANAPGEIFSVAPGIVIAGNNSRIIVSGDYFSNEDSFYINDVAVDATILSEKAVSIELLNPAQGQLDIAIRYDGHSYTSSSSLMVQAPIYYPYAVISVGGTKRKSYFDPLNKSLYVHNSSLSQITRYQYVSGGGWDTTSLSLSDLRSMALSPDLKHMFALRSNDLLEIDIDSFSTGGASPMSLWFNTIMSDLEFDYSNEAVIVTDYQGSGSTPVYFYDAEPLSQTYGTQSSSNFLYNSFIGVSGDGSLMVLGENGLSPVQPLVRYQPITGIFGAVTPTAQYRSADINSDGTKILINNTNIYNSSFSLIGELSAYASITAAAMDSAGQFVVAADSNATLYWYDTSNLSGQVVVPTYNPAITENVGTITDLKLTPDGLTLFVLGSNKTLVIPVWQIKEDAIGSSGVCPSAGCNGINVAQGVPGPGSTDPVIPPFDNLTSPLEHISPTYAGQTHQFEVLLTGSGFLPASVVLFGDTPATNVRYINDTELHATIPALPVGNYTVTVDGHQLNAPEFTVVSQQSITPTSWAIGGNPVEMIYDAMNNALYSLDSIGTTLYRFDLADNSTISQSIANAKDVTWCPADGFLYVATGADIRQYNAATLEYIQTMAITTVDRLECVSENNIVLTAENQWQYYKLFDSDTNSVVTAQTFAGYPAGSLYSPTVDGVSSKGDRVYFGESGITSPNRVLFTPHLLSATNITGAGTFLTSSWSDDGTLGVVNGNTVLNDTLSVLGTLSIAGSTIATTTVAPDASMIFVVTSDANIHKITIDPANPSDFSNDVIYAIPADLGTIRRAESSLDGGTLFVGGTNGIAAISVN